MVKYEIQAQFIPVDTKHLVELNRYGFTVSDYHGWRDIIIKSSNNAIAVPAPFTVQCDKSMTTGFLGLGEP